MGVRGCGCPACNPLIRSRPRVEEIPCTLTHKERNLKRIREQYKEARETAVYCETNQGQYAAHREQILAERKAASAASEVKHFEGETIEVKSPTIEEMLADPTLDSITPVNLDPVSMAVDDIGAMIEEGGEFIKAPSLSGVAAMAITAIPGKAANSALKGRAGKQARLRSLAVDPKLGKADKGWLNQEINSINRGDRKNIRNPPGKDLAHERGREASKGYSYKYSNLQDRKLHRLQHKYDNFGRKNKERPIDE
jgi:hypothetical protein